MGVNCIVSILIGGGALVHHPQIAHLKTRTWQHGALRYIISFSFTDNNLAGGWGWGDMWAKMDMLADDVLDDLFKSSCNRIEFRFKSRVRTQKGT